MFRKLGLPKALALVLAPLTGCGFHHTHTSSQWTTISESAPGQIRLEVNRHGVHTEVELDGELALSSDQRAVIGLSEGGRFEIESSGGEVDHHLSFESGEGGIAIPSYRRDGAPATFDEGAQDWLASVLQDVCRSTSIGARERAQHLLASGGSEALLADFPELANDGAREIYIETLLAHQGTHEVLVGVLDAVGELSSDSAKERLLSGLMSEAPQDSGVGLALLESTAGISSSSTRQALYEAWMEQRPHADALTPSLLAGIARIPSSSSREELLLRVLPRLGEDGQEPWLQVVDQISSTSSRERCLSELLRTRPSTPTRLRLLESARRISSSSSQEKLLLACLAGAPPSSEIDSAVLAVTASIPSSSSQARVLHALLDREELSTASQARLLEAARAIPSSSTRAEILERLAQRALEGEGDGEREW